MRKLVTPSAAPTPAAMKETVEIVAVAWAESMSLHVLGGHWLFTHDLLAEPVAESDIAPVAEPTPMPTTANPKPPQRSHETIGGEVFPSVLAVLVSRGSGVGSGGGEGVEAAVGGARVRPTSPLGPAATSASSRTRV